MHMKSRKWIAPMSGAALLVLVTADWTGGGVALAAEQVASIDQTTAPGQAMAVDTAGTTGQGPSASSAAAYPGAEPVGAGTSPLANRAAEVLNGGQEVPPVTTSASALSSIVVANDLSVSGTVVTTGIEGTAAHVHQAASGANGPVLITLTQTSATQWSVPEGTKLTKAQYDSFKAGALYVNVHSAAHKSGEIRVQLSP
jgi:hypothetical protein